MCGNVINMRGDEKFVEVTRARGDPPRFGVETVWQFDDAKAVTGR